MMAFAFEGRDEDRWKVIEITKDGYEMHDIIGLKKFMGIKCYYGDFIFALYEIIKNEDNTVKTVYRLAKMRKAIVNNTVKYYFTDAAVVDHPNVVTTHVANTSTGEAIAYIRENKVHIIKIDDDIHTAKFETYEDIPLDRLERSDARLFTDIFETMIPKKEGAVIHLEDDNAARIYSFVRSHFNCTETLICCIHDEYDNDIYEPRLSKQTNDKTSMYTVQCDVKTMKIIHTVNGCLDVFALNTKYCLTGCSRNGHPEVVIFSDDGTCSRVDKMKHYRSTVQYLSSAENVLYLLRDIILDVDGMKLPAIARLDFP
jgi:hypothetical protein